MYITFHTPKPYGGQTPCPECGLSAGQVAKTGQVGCGHCYKHFAKLLAPYIRRIHGPVAHSGRIPVSAGAALADKRLLAQLQEKLAAAIAAQEFEECARLRDEIKAITEKEGQ